MRCYCCTAEVNTVRKVRLRPWRDDPGPEGGPDAPAHRFYRREMTYRWAVVCLICYRTLDNATGLAEIGGKLWNIAGASRRDQAAALDEAKYTAWQEREARKLGL